MRKYKVGTDGVRVFVDSPFIKGWVEPGSVEELSRVAERPLPEECKAPPEWHGSKVPASEFEKVLGTIKQYPHMETMFILTHRFSDSAWKITCPEQHGVGANVKSMPTDVVDGFVPVGTIHTHPGMGAFWSTTDIQDARTHGGTHVVLGLVNGVVDSYRCTVYSPDYEGDVPLFSVFEEVDFKADHKPVQEWVDIIEAGKRRNAAEFVNALNKNPVMPGTLFTDWDNIPARNDKAIPSYTWPAHSVGRRQAIAYGGWATALLDIIREEDVEAADLVMAALLDHGLLILDSDDGQDCLHALSALLEKGAGIPADSRNELLAALKTSKPGLSMGVAATGSEMAAPVYALVGGLMKQYGASILADPDSLLDVLELGLSAMGFNVSTPEHATKSMTELLAAVESESSLTDWIDSCVLYCDEADISGLIKLLEASTDA